MTIYVERNVTIVGYLEAAERFRYTPHLLKWFCRYAAKPGEGRKLLEVTEGNFHESELIDFERHLWRPWPTRYVPAGISAELKREASGVCVTCSAPCDVLEESHIRRKGIELEHYCQHPHNLLLLCPTCHRRYDGPSQQLDFETVRHRKEVAQGRLLAEVDRQVAIARAVSQLTAPLRQAIDSSDREAMLEVLDEIGKELGVAFCLPPEIPAEAVLDELIEDDELPVIVTDMLRQMRAQLVGANKDSKPGTVWQALDVDTL